MLFSGLVKSRICLHLLVLIAFSSGTQLLAQKEKNVFAFDGGADGAGPSALVADKSGALYGTTFGGGVGDPVGCCGTVFKLTPPSSPGAAWTESILYDFQGSTDGGQPSRSALVFDTKGNLYGTTFLGGESNDGTIFQLVPPSTEGEAWTKNTIYSFAGADPKIGLAIDTTGALYGADGGGFIYQLKPPGEAGGAWTYSQISDVLRANIDSSLLVDAKGNVYGAVNEGGTFDSGYVFVLRPTRGGTWTELDPYNFTGRRPDGDNPESTLTLKNGIIYGTTEDGGGGQGGTVFSLTPPTAPGASWSETILYSFTRGLDGSSPIAGVAFGSKGDLYGVTWNGGGVAGQGTVYKLSPSAVVGKPWKFTLLHTFTGNNNDLGNSVAALVLSRGLLFGASPLAVFEVAQ